MSALSPPTDVAVSLIGVAKSYGDVEVLKPFDLQVGEGEFVVLLGPSGCGKSTILKMIAGLEEASQGEIHVAGELVNYVRPRDRNVAMVFQNYALYPHMTVRDNIAFPLKMARRPRLRRSVIDERTVEAAEIVDLTPYLDRKPAQLSGGQRQRVALARAIIRQPEAFLMDEPLSNLDALLRADMRTSLLEVHSRIQKATLYVTHDQIEAMTMADRVVVLNAGRIQQMGKPHELFNAPANTFVAQFIGSPRMSLHPAEASADGTLPFGGALLLAEAGVRLEPNASITVGVRPSALRVADEAHPCFVGRATRRDYLGSDSYLEVELEAGPSVMVRAEADSPLAPGDPVHIGAEPGAIHLFDGAGTRLCGASVSRRGR
ncbi:MAG: ABC transporter ATP-binding protein [Acidimicrobiaceae bacterium]|nr:ABC transporter ATP-binding protein [Acidimicrobiaceae bacterium]